MPLVSSVSSFAFSLFGSFEEDAAVVDAPNIFLLHDAIGGPEEKVCRDPCSKRVSVYELRNRLTWDVRDNAWAWEATRLVAMS